MGQFYDQIPDSPDLARWISEQKIFFVGTAPLESGNVNISPKGTVGSFHIIDANHVWYEDLTGSGSETIAHLHEPGNGRITIMFTAFTGPPRIVRLFGKGRAYFRGSDEYERYLPDVEGRNPGSRAVVVVEIHKVGSSCGYSIPFYEYLKDRDVLDNWARKKERVTDLSAPYNPASSSAYDPPSSNTTSPPPTDKEDLRVYWHNRNARSIDGLPSLGTFLFPDDPSSPSATTVTTTTSSPSPTKKGCTSSARTAQSRLPSLQTLSTHAAVGALAGGAVYAYDCGWLSGDVVKMGVGLVGATGAWVVGTMVGVPVPAPCCAMGM